jgi:AmiR/NasT family two-component response regulator
VDCAALSTLLRSPLTDCRPDTIYRMSGTTVASEGLPAANYTILDRQGQPTAQHLRLAQDVPVLAIPDGLVQGIDGFGLQGDLLVPPSMITDADRPDAVLVGTDGRTATIEAVRAALGPVRTPFAAVTAEEATQIARSSSDSYAHAALLGLTLVVLVGGLSVAVTTSDSLRERRRALAALTAIGTPTRVLRRSVLLQTALPLLLGVGLALLVAAAASWLYLRLGASIDTPAPPLPWAGYGAVGTSAIIASLLATAAALPFIQGATRPDALRAE